MNKKIKVQEPETSAKPVPSKESEVVQPRYQLTQSELDFRERLSQRRADCWKSWYPLNDGTLTYAGDVNASQGSVEQSQRNIEFLFAGSRGFLPHDEKKGRSSGDDLDLQIRLGEMEYENPSTGHRSQDIFEPDTTTITNKNLLDSLSLIGELDLYGFDTYPRASIREVVQALKEMKGNLSIQNLRESKRRKIASQYGVECLVEKRKPRTTFETPEQVYTALVDYINQKKELAQARHLERLSMEHDFNEDMFSLENRKTKYDPTGEYISNPRPRETYFILPSDTIIRYPKTGPNKDKMIYRYSLEKIDQFLRQENERDRRRRDCF